MTEDEYRGTVAAGKGISSRGDFSFSEEGTSFSEHAEDAESYANFGRTDPRKTNKPNYLVEIAPGPGLERGRDGYFKATGPIPRDRITRIYEMRGEGGSVVGAPIDLPAAAAALRMEPFGQRGVIVKGTAREDKATQGRIKALGGRWSPKAQGWIIPKSKESRARAGLTDLLGAPAAAPTPEPAPAVLLPEGWTEASPGGLATGPVGIVDRQIATGKWFAVPHREGAETLEGFDTRAEAIAALQALQAQSLGDRLRAGPVRLSEAVRAIDPKAQAGTVEHKVAEEQIEAVLVETARAIVRDNTIGGRDPGTTFDELLALQNNAPTLQTRTSGSMQRQAYSTPIAIAYAASRLAGAGTGVAESALEPTAGNGALLLERFSRGTVVNEIDETRAANLERQGFSVSREDATTAQFPPVDTILANPPFGALIQSEEEGRAQWMITSPAGEPLYETGEIDHAIAWNALKSLAPDGSAVLLLAGPSPQALSASTDAHRRKVYMSGAKQKFYYALYDHFRVTDHVTLEGDLYKKQGAGWPIDVVVIRGRGKASRPLPARQIPRVIRSWDEVKEIAVNGRAAEERPGVVPAGGEPAAGGGGIQQAGIGAVPELAPVPGADGGPGAVDVGQLGPGGPAPVERPAPEERYPPGAGAGAGRPGGGRAGGRGGRAAVDVGGAPAAEGPPREPGVPEGGVSPGVGEQPGARGQPAAGAPAGPSLDNFTDEELDATIAAALGTTSVGPTSAPNPDPAPVPPSPPTAGEAAAAAAQNATAAIDQGLTAIFKLLGGDQPGTLGSGPVIDETTYQAARPHFQAMWQSTKAAGGNLADFVSALVSRAQEAYGPQWEQFKETFGAMLKRFAQEMRTATKPEIAETTLQKAYQPSSTQGAIGTLTPTNLVDPTAKSLAALSALHGSVDTFIMKEMGWSEAQLTKYLAAEQIDALALALDKLKVGGGFIIGDQTGVGKGRVNAAIIQWAKRNKFIPVFVTEKPNLYADMMRDLGHTGAPSFKPLVTNSGLAGNNAIPLPDGTFLSTAGGTAHAKELQAAFKRGVLHSYDGIFTTYAQAQTIKGAMKPRHHLLDQAMPNAILILDESHNAGGVVKEQRGKKEAPPDRAQTVRAWVSASKGTFYSSATFAKRPDVMSLYSKTGLGSVAAGDPKKLEIHVRQGRFGAATGGLRHARRIGRVHSTRAQLRWRRVRGRGVPDQSRVSRAGGRGDARDRRFRAHLDHAGPHRDRRGDRGRGHDWRTSGAEHLEHELHGDHAQRDRPDAALREGRGHGRARPPGDRG